MMVFMQDLTWVDCILNPVPYGMLAGHLAFGKEKLIPIGRIHYVAHWLYGKHEPLILRLVDWVLRRAFVTGTAVGRSLMTLLATLSHPLPHGVVVPTPSAAHLVHHLENLPGDTHAPRLAVGPCVCQMSLGRWKEPSCKDIVVLYGADIYLHLERGYRVITAGEAVTILEQCRDAGLVHSLDFCMQSGRWHFVICNCDREICVLTRTFLLTGKMLYAGPWIVRQDPRTCLGPDRCGRCVDICLFGANSVRNGTVVADDRACLGCGQCVRICPGTARELHLRKRYVQEHVIPADVLTPDRSDCAGADTTLERDREP